MAILTRQEITDKIELFFGVGTDKVSKAEMNEFMTDLKDSLSNVTTDSNLFGLLKHDPVRDYKQGEGTLYSGQLFYSNENQSAGVFDHLKWRQITGLQNASSYGGAWDNGTAYLVDELVERNNKLFKAVAGSQGIDPITDVNEDFWTEVSASSGVFGEVWKVGFFVKDTVVLNPFDSNLYKLINATDPFDSTSITTEIAGGDWVLIHDVGSISDVEVKTKYENNSNTNVFTDLEKQEVANIPTVATQQEVDLGEDNTKIVTPRGLKFQTDKLIPLSGTIGNSAPLTYSGFEIFEDSFENHYFSNGVNDFSFLNTGDSVLIENEINVPDINGIWTVVVSFAGGFVLNMPGAQIPDNGGVEIPLNAYFIFSEGLAGNPVTGKIENSQKASTFPNYNDLSLVDERTVREDLLPVFGREYQYNESIIEQSNSTRTELLVYSTNLVSTGGIYRNAFNYVLRASTTQRRVAIRGYLDGVLVFLLRKEMKDSNDIITESAFSTSTLTAGTSLFEMTISIEGGRGTGFISNIRNEFFKISN